MDKISFKYGAIGLFVISVIALTSCEESSDTKEGEGGSGDSNGQPVVSVDWLNDFSLPEQDEDGWSILTPSEDSRLIYVSEDGDDNTAQFYLSSSEEVGSDPFAPSGSIKAYASIDSAMEQMRAGYPDYVFLKRGDTWERNETTIKMKPGRSADERAVLAYYGTDKERPVVKTGNIGGINFTNNKAINSAAVGIKFVAQKRNPASSDFVGFANISNAEGFYVRNQSDTGNMQFAVLIEDCWFDWYYLNKVDSQHDEATLTDVVIRRNIISNNYGNAGRPQGLWSDHASILLEENVFDHNGWYRQSETRGLREPTEDGQACYLTHNTYFAEAFNVIFRNNIFMRPSSIGNKFTSNPVKGGQDEILSWNILLENNLYIDGEFGISIGGNNDNDNGFRWENIHVTHNVLMHIGNSRPTLRELGWGIEVSDWYGGVVQGNIMTTWGNEDVDNCYALEADGHIEGVDYSNNIVYNITSGQPLVQLEGYDGIHKNITFSNNEIQANSVDGVDRSGRLLQLSIDQSGGFYDNYYYSERDTSEWFSGMGENFLSLSDYRSYTDDTSSVAEKKVYPNPDRTIETYLEKLGYSTDMDDFIDLLSQQSKFNWNEDLSTESINDYIREGFSVD